MIVWSGWGILTIVIAALVGGGVTAAAVAALKGAGLPEAEGYALVLGLLAAAAVNWVVGRRLNSQPGREMIDKTTGQTLVLRRRHSLFFIRMEWWSLVLAAAAVVALGSMLLGRPATNARPGTTASMDGPTQVL